MFVVDAFLFLLVFGVLLIPPGHSGVVAHLYLPTLGDMDNPHRLLRLPLGGGA